MGSLLPRLRGRANDLLRSLEPPAGASVASAALIAARVAHGRSDRADRPSRHLRRSRRDLQPRRTPSRAGRRPGIAVTVDVTRGGRDARQLTIATGEIRGYQTLRVALSRRIASSIPRSARARGRSSTWTTTARSTTDNSGRNWRDWGENNSVDIRDSGAGIDAHADLVVGVPKGQRIVAPLGCRRRDGDERRRRHSTQRGRGVGQHRAHARRSISTRARAA